MRKLSILLVFVMLFNVMCIGVSAETTLPNDIDTEQIVMPDLGIDIPKISKNNVDRINKIADEITALAATRASVERSDLSRSEKDSLINAASSRSLSLKSELLSLGALKLSDKQALMYVYGLNENQLLELESLNGSNNTRDSVPGINYPSISGIEFYIFEYTVSFSGGPSYPMANCIALPVENTTSKMVRSSDWIDMYNSTKISTLVGKLVNFSAEEVSGYLLSSAVGGAWSFAIRGLWDLTGDIFPASTSTNEASLDLKVTSSSRIIHYWHKINGTYYFRLATCAAVIRESWLLVDSNGYHKYKYHEFWAYSKYHREGADERAVSINNSEPYSIYLPYKVQKSILGINYWDLRLEVSPFHAALPIHFAS